MRHAYVPLISTIGLLVVGHCISELIRNPINPEWWILAGLTLLTGFFTVKIPSLPVRLSVSEPFVFASVILFGVCAGTLTVALDVLVAVVGRGGRARDPIRVLFNVSSGALSIWCASQVFYTIAGRGPFSGQQLELRILLLPLLGLALVFFVLNTGMVAIAVSLHRAVNPFNLWRTNFLALALNYLGGASLAALLVSYTNTVDLITLGIIVPLLVVSYLTYKTSLGRVEDATKHVEEVNSLYLSTIETLATAIDAKDQVTHGHIRRVQKFALGLAAELGIKDERLMKAIEAAALLHDTGKLVVPEHILNKPGRLTSGEFEKMKRHASAGAEILSAINFPYPVVPIVRHHHENWNGSGYPDGLRSTEIPVGARILAVVDCFDALTSDRPYRQRLSDDEALQILLQRRGSMYDPLVVDTFVAVKDKLAVSLVASESRVETMVRNERLHQDDNGGLDIGSAISNNAPVLQLANLIVQSIVDATPAKIVVFFTRDPRRDELHVLYARSREASLPLPLVIPVGSNVSGWVAANGSPIINADAGLDLPGDSDRLGVSRCLCVPLRHSADIIGVVSLYLDDPRGFSERDLIVVEAALKAVDLRPLVEFLAGLSKPGTSTTRQPPTVH